MGLVYLVVRLAVRAVGTGIYSAVSTYRDGGSFSESLISGATSFLGSAIGTLIPNVPEEVLGVQLTYYATTGVISGGSIETFGTVARGARNVFGGSSRWSQQGRRSSQRRSSKASRQRRPGQG